MEEQQEQKRESSFIQMKIDPEQHERIRKLADYAASQGFIDGHHLGNMTQFINWCITLGQETLRQYALKKRGF